MLAKGDLKFRLQGRKLKGEFVLARMRSRRPGSKGTEWLLIKKRDQYAKEEFDIEKMGRSVLTKRTLEEIAGDAGSSEWQSNRPAAGKGKNAWLADSLAKLSRRGSIAEDAEDAEASAKEEPKKASGRRSAASVSKKKTRKTAASSASSRRVTLKKNELASIEGAVKAPMPQAIRPMLATLVDEPFNSPEWLYEIKWDGYRALAYLENGRVRLASRNQLDMTLEFPELQELATHFKAEAAILDGEIVALDEEGRPSFSLMQQRGSGRRGGQRAQPDRDFALAYYLFDLLYLDGYSLLRVDLDKRKQLLAERLASSTLLRYSEHFDEGLKLYEAARARGLEGMVAKRRRSCYLTKRSREWLKMKITKRQECVIGGYTDPRGSREHFGSIVLGLYDDKGRLIHVGNAGSGFNEQTHADLWQRLQQLKRDKSPFFGPVDASRRVHWVRPELVAEIKLNEWTHGRPSARKGGARRGPEESPKMRAPVYQGLRFDKPPRECVFERPLDAQAEAQKAESGEAA
jgi:bifunctional non-homologous end joining protein LigD